MSLWGSSFKRLRALLEQRPLDERARVHHFIQGFAKERNPMAPAMNHGEHDLCCNRPERGAPQPAATAGRSIHKDEARVAHFVAASPSVRHADDSHTRAATSAEDAQQAGGGTAK